MPLSRKHLRTWGPTVSVTLPSTSLGLHATVLSNICTVQVTMQGSAAKKFAAPTVVATLPPPAVIVREDIDRVKMLATRQLAILKSTDDRCDSPLVTIYSKIHTQHL